MEMKVQIFHYKDIDEFMYKYFTLTEYLDKALSKNLISCYDTNMYVSKSEEMEYLLEFIIWL
jgi:predicted component of type VI protein secretion system